MADFDKCPICGEYGLLGGKDGDLFRHRCEPAWEVCMGDDYQPVTDDEDDQNSWHTIYAHDAKQAAEKWAARWYYECANYEPMPEYTIIVRRRWQETVQWFTATGEASMIFKARETAPVGRD